MKIWNQHLRLLDTEGLPGVKVDRVSEPPSVISVGVAGSDGVVAPSVILPANDMKNKNNISDVTLFLNSACLIKKSCSFGANKFQS